ncbi:bifunctional hydroxymethylpyrimidine kinase/phosphomethylpyrimidine kinase [Bacillus taeanensis]|uniref:Hydroxymethylpyrimidine/phosphomethylpyrimidine kinase n=1 Tax=Bacillus taeanensis TaxID=273032 RepID=A0A366XY56_9BACI|nr:bifunctional hydroxymethylpyrimidine kinase/phosphomethylpyrimidine kinase [Bacillus taeanensis]RBW70566.1 bifunctional hydroxymethylpyrimidine kinase/phosphomethylpyrimidine kinase [Bacillus taeanensis]
MAIAKALTIAGSDSGGGAGIQADLKTFQERDVYGMSVITALTAQNTRGVHGVYPQSLEAIQAQMDAVISDIGVHALKTGMLFSAEIIELIAEKIKENKLSNVVIDPVMIAKGGAPLLQEQAMTAMKEKLLPLATVITPNLPEASKLIGWDNIETVDEMKEAAKILYDLGSASVLVKGGHLDESNKAIDLLYDGRNFEVFKTKRIDTKHTHGTGCTFSAAITAELAKGKSVSEAVALGKEFITTAIEHSLNIGAGIGPTNHSAYRHYVVKST